jgi:hypothetical protein
MTSDTSGRRGAFMFALLKPLALLSLFVLLPALSACTTDEGTNALVDPSTFEREVMDPTLQGLDIIPPDPAKAAPERRAPLVLPKGTGVLPPPSTNTANAQLPVDSSDPSVNTAGLSQADLAHLRNAKVIDLASLNGRPLTDIERRQLAARLQVANTQVPGARPLTLPPASYFTSYQGKDAICKAADGSLVSLSDPKCPDQIRHALRGAQPVAGSVANDIQSQTYDMENGINPNDPNQYVNGH